MIIKRTMLDSKNPLVRLLSTYVLWLGSEVLGGSLIYLYFRDSGISETGLVFGTLFWALAPLPVIALLNKKTMDFRQLMFLGIAARAAGYGAVAFLPPSMELFIFYCLMLGVPSFIFWAPFNIMYFEMSRGRAAQFGSVYFSMTQILGLVLPLAAGMIAMGFGMQAVFACAAFLYATVLVPVSALEDRKEKYSFDESAKELKGFKTLILVEGVYGGGVATAFVVIPLLYFKTPLELGAYISATTILSIIASFIASRLSDKMKKRRRYIDVFGSGLSLTTIAATFASTAGLWYVAVSVRNFFSTLFYPFTTAIIVDSGRDMTKSMVMREFLLNVGRVFGILAVLFFTFFLSNIHLSLALLGAVLLFYPLIIELKKRHINVA
ncbi:MFS transporter [Candidatus Micrarchaeota archaeon]|nr:MFS transporter [Candidatus Micrarchaeota archaeon]